MTPQEQRPRKRGIVRSMALSSTALAAPPITGDGDLGWRLALDPHTIGKEQT